jgi:hypothetical protein
MKAANDLKTIAEYSVTILAVCLANPPAFRVHMYLPYGIYRAELTSNTYLISTGVHLQ